MCILVFMFLVINNFQYAAAGVDVNATRVFKGHQLPVTSVAMTPDDKYIYSGSKDCCIIKCKARK